MTVRVYLPVAPGVIAAIRGGADAARPGEFGYAVTSRVLRDLGLGPGSDPSADALELAEFEAFSQAVAAADRAPARVVVVAADVAEQAITERSGAGAGPSSAAVVELLVGVTAGQVVCAHVSDPRDADDLAEADEVHGPDPMAMSWYDVSEFDELAALLARD